MSDVIIADADLQAKLERVARPVRICAPDGEVIAYATRPVEPERLQLDPPTGGRSMDAALRDFLDRQSSSPAGVGTIIRSDEDRRPPSPLSTQTPEQAARLQAIMARRGVVGKATFENLLGAGEDLWDSEEEFEQFLERIRESRAKG